MRPKLGAGACYRYNCFHDSIWFVAALRFCVV
jgi:hypothetical protein